MRKKLFYIPVLTMLVLGFYLGFSDLDPKGSRTPQTYSDNHGNTTPVEIQSAGTVVFVDSLNGNNDTTALKSRGYKPYYRGTGPQGTTATWYQGTTPFPAFNGPATGYVAANYNVVTNINNIDSWLVLPRIAGTGILSGDSLYFYERSITGNTFPDSMRVMYSANDSTPEGSWTELGRFLNTISGSWTRRGYRAPSASLNGRFALRYCVANGGPNGANSNFIGVDMITIERTAAPPPPSTWHEQTTPVTTTLYSVSAVDNNVVWACGAAGRVIMTTNGGTWVNATGTGIPAALALYNIWGINSTTALVTGSDAVGTYIYRTSNSGSTWTQVHSQAGGFFNVILMSNATTGWVQGDPVSNRWSLWGTTNGGVTWDSTGRFLPMTGSEAGWNNSAHWVGNNIWFGTNNTKVYYSANNGQTWTGQALGELNSYAVNFNATGTGFAGGALLRMSTNNGSSWAANTTLGTGNFTGIANNGNDWWQVRQANGIFYSSNNGTSWTQQHTAPAGTYSFITRARDGFMLYAVRSNGAVSKWGPTSGIDPVSTVASDYKLSQNYPNPFNPATKINFSLPKNGFVTLKVYDILGKEVATLVNEFKATGTYAVDFNATNLASGIYLYKIQADGFTATKRMMLVK